MSLGFSFFFSFFPFVEQFPELRQPACEHGISCKTHAYNTTWPKYITAHLVKSCKRLNILLEMNYIAIPEEASRPLGTGITASSHFPSCLFLWKTTEQLFQPATEQPSPRLSEQCGAAASTRAVHDTAWRSGVGSRWQPGGSARTRPRRTQQSLARPPLAAVSEQVWGFLLRRQKKRDLSSPHTI